MARTLARLDYFLLVVGIASAFGGWRDGYGFFDFIWPLATVYFIFISKRNGSGLSELLAYFGTLFYIIGHWNILIPQNVLGLSFLKTLLIAAAGAFILSNLLRLTTSTLTITWTVYFILVLYSAISSGSIADLLSIINYPEVTTSITERYSAILILSLIAGIFVDLQSRNRFAARLT